MKKFLGLICGAALAAVVCTQTTGCKSIPETDSVYSLAFASGLATGFGLQVGKVEVETQQKILQIVDIVHATVPKTNETFEVAWMPVIRDELKKLVDAQELTEQQSQLIEAGSLAACKAIDYLFTRHPDWKQYEELVCAATDGFCTGFQSVIKPVNADQAAALRQVMDVPTYKLVQSEYALAARK